MLLNDLCCRPKKKGIVFINILLFAALTRNLGGVLQMNDFQMQRSCSTDSKAEAQIRASAAKAKLAQAEIELEGQQFRPISYRTGTTW